MAITMAIPFPINRHCFMAIQCVSQAWWESSAPWLLQWSVSWRRCYGLAGLALRGTQNGWFTTENPNLKWMMNRGTPIYGNLQILYLLSCTICFREQIFTKTCNISPYSGTYLKPPYYTTLDHSITIEYLYIYIVLMNSGVIYHTQTKV